MFKRNRRSGVQVVVVTPDGHERPVWALRAGQLVTATDYDHGAQRMTVWVEQVEGQPPAYDWIAQAEVES